MPQDIQDSFEPPFGDRRQEIVFIGIGMNPEAICKELDSCLLSQSEMEELKTKCVLMETIEEKPL
jgi:hypothetical protein